MSLVRIADLIEERDDGGVLIFPRLFFWKVRDMSGFLLSLLFNLAMIRKKVNTSYTKIS